MYITVGAISAIIIGSRQIRHNGHGSKRKKRVNASETAERRKIALIVCLYSKFNRRERADDGEITVNSVLPLHRNIQVCKMVLYSTSLVRYIIYRILYNKKYYFLWLFLLKQTNFCRSEI